MEGIVDRTGKIESKGFIQNLRPVDGGLVMTDGQIQIVETDQTVERMLQVMVSVVDDLMGGGQDTQAGKPG